MATSNFEAPDDLLDEKDVAAWLKMSVRTVQAWRVSGAGPRFVRLNRAVRYRRADVLDYLTRRTVASTSQVAA